MAELPEWRNMMAKGGEKAERWRDRFASAEEAVAEGSAFRGINCHFDGGDELVESWARLSADAAAGSTAMSSVSLAKSAAIAFLKPP
eukprot:gene56563-19420_t